MDWNATTSSANATSCSNLDMRGMAQALHDDLSQAHHDRDSVRALFSFAMDDKAGIAHKVWCMNSYKNSWLKG